MLKRSTRRWLAGLGVAGAFVAASAAPAAADPTPADVTLAEVQEAKGFGLFANNVTVAPGGPEKWVTLRALTDQPLTEYTVTVDRGAVDDFAEVQVTDGPGLCKEDKAVITCEVRNAEPEQPVIQFPVLPLDGSKPGQEGELAFTVTTPGGASASFRSTVTIGEGVDLVSDTALALTGRPGETMKARLAVANRGETTVDGSVLLVWGAYALSPSKRYENCEYGTGGPNFYTPNMFACTFDDLLKPGAGARVDAGFGFTVPGDAWAPDEQVGFAVWLTPADWAEARADFDFSGDKGTDGMLKLEPTDIPGTLSSAAQTDVDPYNNETMVTIKVKGNQKADVAADGATVTAKVGKTMPLEVGFTNNGPAAINTGGNGIFTAAVVTVPKGTTVVKAPENCFDIEAEEGGDLGKPGGSVYACFVDGIVGKGKKATFPFSLRIDKAGALTGEVELFHSDASEGRGEDLNKANDIAKILVNDSDGGGEGGGDGGTLPITGSSTGLIAGIGALLLVAGVGGYLVAKRRRTRFVA
ncbi:LPXTG cell wall anchor domain-containing protein [Micromonospora sp. NPDC048830]|uniref:LPXTG cell wall anchor domain-containing protein n=1 Tax=Micromonospora sp. NPDC048830 TaxID=3364257 RepID=UPI003715EA89